MRFLLEVTLDTQAGNRALTDPNFLKNLEAGLSNIKAEASYFTENNGDRTAYIIADLPSADMIPVVAEPFFQQFNAKVKFHPAMVLDDLKKGVDQFQRAAQHRMPR